MCCETTPALSLLRHFTVKAVLVEVTDLFKLAGCRILDPEANARFATLVFVDFNRASRCALEETAGADHNALRGCSAAACDPERSTISGRRSDFVSFDAQITSGVSKCGINTQSDCCDKSCSFHNFSFLG